MLALARVMVVKQHISFFEHNGMAVIRGHTNAPVYTVSRVNGGNETPLMARSGKSIIGNEDLTTTMSVDYVLSEGVYVVRDAGNNEVIMRITNETTRQGERCIQFSNPESDSDESDFEPKI